MDDTAPAIVAPPSVADGVERPLDPRSIALGRTTGWIATAAVASILLLPLLLVLLFAPLLWWAKAALAVVWLAVTATLGWFAQRWPAIEHRHAAYRVDGQGIEIRRGVVWRKVIDVPRSRVQHTDVSQGPLERSHGLGTLAIYTAGTAYAKVDLHGLDHATALAIRDHLLPRDGGDAL